MIQTGHLRNAILALALTSLILPEEAVAIEIFTGPGPAMQTHMDDGLLTRVFRGGGMRRGGGGRGGGARFSGGGMHRGGGARFGGGGYHGGGARFAGGAHRGGGRYAGGAYRGGGARVAGGAYRGGAYRGGAYRGGARVAGGAYRGGAWAGRPGWYRWPAGGAIAAGAALGWVSAATASSWAGYPPQEGLCWYYTDASRHQGFWDVCQ